MVAGAAGGEWIMPVLQIEYDVPDFGDWKAVFDQTRWVARPMG